MNEQRYLTKSSFALAAIVFGLLLGRGDSAAAQQPEVRVVATDSVVANHPAATASLPAPYKVVGGGARANWSSNGSLLTQSRPGGTGQNTWTASSKDHLAAEPVSITAFAIGLADPADEWEVIRRESRSPVSAQPVATASLPPGYAMTGGGCLNDWRPSRRLGEPLPFPGPAGNLLTGSFPSSASSWECRGQEHGAASPASIVAYVIGIRPKRAGVPLPEVRITSATSEVGAHVTAIALAAPGFVITGGGAVTGGAPVRIISTPPAEPIRPRDPASPPPAQGQLLTATFPEVPAGSAVVSGWRAMAKDHIYSSPGIVVAYAVNLRFAPPNPPASPPRSPDLVAGMSNANLLVIGPNQPVETVFFSSVAWQSTNRRALNFAWGWYPDLLVSTPYAFQVQIASDLFNSAFEVRDSTGRVLRSQQPRVNRTRACGVNGANTCFLSPGDAGFTARPVPAADVSTYTLQAETLCDGRPNYGNNTCTGKSDAGLLLTINPPTSPLAPQHGQSYEYTLLWKNAAGQAARKVKAVYVEPIYVETSTSPIPPSHVYCGNINKDVRGPGNCAGNGTDFSGRIPAFERTEMRGWIVREPGWPEIDEMGLSILLDWGWTANAGIRAINTPEKIIETVTPFNVLTFGVDPSDRTAGGRPLLPTQTSGEAWGGPNAAVIHVENQGWRFSDAAPSGWTISRRSTVFSADLLRPTAVPPLAADATVGIGDYVRIVGTQWEDSCHCQGIPPFNPITTNDTLALSAIGRWIDGTFGHGVKWCPPAEPGHRVFCIQGRGWTEMHPVDYIATFPGPTNRMDTLEIIAMAGAGEVRRSIKLPPKPSANARVVFREIDSPFTLLLNGDLAAKDLTVTNDGLDVHIKLNARSGIAPGYPKFFAGFYVAWQE